MDIGVCLSILNGQTVGCGRGSEKECLPGMWKTLGLILCASKQNQHKGTNNKLKQKDWVKTSESMWKPLKIVANEFFISISQEIRMPSLMSSRACKAVLQRWTTLDRLNPTCTKGRAQPAYMIRSEPDPREASSAYTSGHKTFSDQIPGLGLDKPSLLR